jgi:hypothetical protein
LEDVEIVQHDGAICGRLRAGVIFTYRYKKSQ